MLATTLRTNLAGCRVRIAGACTDLGQRTGELQSRAQVRAAVTAHTRRVCVRAVPCEGPPLSLHLIVQCVYGCTDLTSTWLPYYIRLCSLAAV